MDLNFDQFVEVKSGPCTKAFIFLLGDELPYLSTSEYWTNQPQEDQIYMVRLAEDDFHCLDIGRHPKTIIFDGAKEHKTFDGVLELPKIKQEFRRIRSRIR